MASRMLRVALQPTPEAVMPVLRHESLPGHFMSTFLLTATNPITIVAFLGIFAFFGIGAFGLSNAMAAWLVAGVFAGSSNRSEEHTSELLSLMRISIAVFCL